MCNSPNFARRGAAARLVRSRLGRLSAALLLALVAALVSGVLAVRTAAAAAPAQPPPCDDPGTAIIIDPVGGRLPVRMYSSSPAAASSYDTSIQRIELEDGRVVYGYCIDSAEARASGVRSCLAGELSNIRLAYLIGKYPPDLQNRINQAARQAAVWHFSNGIRLDLSNPTPEGDEVDAAVASLYTAMVAEAEAIDPDNPPAILAPGPLALAIEPPAAVNQLPGAPQHAITVTLTKGGEPLPDIEVQVAASFGQLEQATATTDANGQASFTLRSDLAGTASITATAVVTAPTAYEYVVESNPRGLQPFGVPGSIVSTVEATATKEWLPPPPEPGRIILTKNVEGAAAEEEWSFRFTLDGSDPRTATNTAPEVAWEGLEPDRTYILREEDPGSGWTVGSFACEVDGVPLGSSGPDGFAVPVTAGVTVSCSIVNTKVQIGPLYAVGDLVWLDVAGIERDGIQQEIEQTTGGINGVRVELYDGAGNFLQSTATGNNTLGQPGYYLFSELPAGAYQVRFCLPSGYAPTLQNVGSDDRLDSDGNTSGTSETCGGTFYATEVFDLPNSLTDANRADLSRDFGVWRPSDYGDNPNAPVQYPTEARNLPDPAEAARHIIVADLYFGATVDAEDDGQAATPANGDDLNGVLGEDDEPIDDEDGVVFLTPLQPCTTGQVQLTAFTGGRVAYYGAFFDFNGDGVFGPGEAITGEIGTVGAPSETTVIAVSVPCDARRLIYMRFRLALDAAEVAAGTGTATSGEVEDYVLAAVGDRVWFDRDRDGLQGPPAQEPGVPGVVAILCDGATGQPVIVGGQPLTTTTDAQGIYGFYNLPLGSYCVQFDLETLPRDYEVTLQNVGGDDARDSDADESGRTGSTPVLTPGQVDLTLDMGIVTVTPTGEEPQEEPQGGFRMYLPDVRQ